MRKLIAKCPILYHSHTYQEGEELPTDNIDNVKLWREKEVAEWQQVEEVSEQIEKNESESDTTDIETQQEEEEQKEVQEKAPIKPAARNTASKTKLPTGRNNKK